MSAAISTFALRLRLFLFIPWLRAAFLACPGFSDNAQKPVPSSVEAQREAMHKLSFLAGRWSGPATIRHGSGEALHLTQTEDVKFKLDGLVLLIEGKSSGAEGKVMFSALATIPYDDSSLTSRFLAYNDGHYVDTKHSVPPNGFSWSFTTGPAHVVNSMHLTEKGEWDEVTEVTVGSNPGHRTVEMLLRRLP